MGTILERPHNRVQLLMSTQAGKSLGVAIACMIGAIVLGDRIAIVAPNMDKAKIIMDYVIDHIGDSPVFENALELEKGETLERIKRYKQKTRLSFRGGGEIRTFSGDSRNKTQSTRSLMGFGSPTVILDESSLIDDELYSTVKRMVGGYKNGFLLEIGNPFENNHFRRTWQSPRYLRFFVDYRQALKEGAYTEDFIEEMRHEALFNVLYECKFPHEASTGMEGVYRLLSPFIHYKAVTRKGEKEPNSVIGVDPTRGGLDEAVVIKRGSRYAKILWKKKGARTEEIANIIRRLIQKNVAAAENVFVDEIGIGGAVIDLLASENIHVSPVNASASASDKTRFKNLRAEMFWDLKMWIEDSLLEKRKPLIGVSTQWKQLSYLLYDRKTGKVRMRPKEEIKERMGGKSPDVADALSLTFAYDREIIVPKKKKSQIRRLYEADMRRVEKEKFQKNNEENWMDV